MGISAIHTFRLYSNADLRSDFGLIEQTFPEVPVVRADRVVLCRQKLQRPLGTLLAVIFLGVDVGQKIKGVARVDVIGFLYVGKLTCEVLQSRLG